MNNCTVLLKKPFACSSQKIGAGQQARGLMGQDKHRARLRRLFLRRHAPKTNTLTGEQNLICCLLKLNLYLQAVVGYFNKVRKLFGYNVVQAHLVGNMGEVCFFRL